MAVFYIELLFTVIKSYLNKEVNCAKPALLVGVSRLMGIQAERERALSQGTLKGEVSLYCSPLV